MDISMGDVWPPVVPSMTDLPITDPLCVNESCTAFYAAENASQAAIPFDSLGKYAHWMTWYYITILGILALVRVFQLLQDHRPIARKAVNKKPSISQKIMAVGRYIFYRHTAASPFIKPLGLPLNGTLIFLLSTVLFTTILSFAIKPYYRAHLGYGSPPLAIRTGFMAFACIPILIALAGKANLITLFTGISHEKLNILHRWIAWISFGLALTHTIPFLWISYTDGGTANVSAQFFAGNTGRTEWGGLPPLLILFLLCLLSLPPIRAHLHSLFHKSHIALSITYLSLLFWHAGNTLDSWAYLWATLALWLSSWLVRAFWSTRPTNIRNQWFVGAPATVSVLKGSVVRMEVLGVEMGWRAGQHCFLRVPGVEVLGNHPFTVACAPGIHDKRSMIFLVKAHKGFSRKLLEYSISHPDARPEVWIEGPYGGISRPVERVFDTVVLVAGGTGITACLPWLEFLTVGGGQNCTVQRIVLVWFIRDREHYSWVEKMLKDVKEREASVSVEMKIFITAEDGGTADRERQIEMKEIAASSSSFAHTRPSTEFGQGRPNLRTLTAELVGEGKTLVIGCGPDSMRTDLANACADLQSRVLRGRAKEIVMHLEAFGW